MDNYDKIIKFVAKELTHDNSGYGIQHTKRVFNNAKKILAIESGNQKIVLTSALIHDTIDKKLFKNIEERLNVVKNFLKQNSFTDNEINEIIFIISNISWNNGENKRLETLNAQIVRDADRLDAIGAMGIIKKLNMEIQNKESFMMKKI